MGRGDRITKSLGTASTKAGFSLIQVTMLLAVAGLLMVAMLPGGELGSESDKQGITIKRMQGIEDATRSFMLKNQRRPCPANGTAPFANTRFGVEGTPGWCKNLFEANFAASTLFTGDTTAGLPVVTSVSSTAGLYPGLYLVSNAFIPTVSIVSVDSSSQITLSANADVGGTGMNFINYYMAGGGVPTKSLGLPDEYALDGWGRRIMYAVDVRTTSAAACTATERRNDKGNLSIKNNNHEVVDQTMWALVSYGTDGNGAFPMEGGTVFNDINNLINSGTTDTDELLNATGFYGGGGTMVGSFVRKDATPTFHDVVWYRDATKSMCCWGPIERSITSPANGTYATGQVLTFVLNYGIPVTVTGNPRIRLAALGSGSIGTSNVAYAYYASGSGTTSISFTYTVQATDNAPSGIIATSPIDVNGGTMDSCALYFDVPNLSGVIISTVPPGFIYVADSNNNRIEKFDMAGTYLSQFGSAGSGNGQFGGVNSIDGIAVDIGGNVWVLDYNNNRVQEFDGNGTYLSQFGTAGSGNGQFYGPSGIAIDRSGNIWVSDSGNTRVQEFDSSGTYLSQFGTAGSGNGQFTYPLGIAIDGSNNIWVTDYFNARVEKFNSSGTYLSQFGSAGSGNGQFNSPAGIVIDASGNIWVVDSGNHRIQKFDSSGTYLSQFGSTGSGNGQFASANRIATDLSGNVWVTESYGNNRVQKFDNSGTYQSQFGSYGTGNGQFHSPEWGIAIYIPPTPPYVYVTDSSNNRVQKFDSTGRYITQWGSAGSGDGQFNFPWGVAVDLSGNVYVTDWLNHRVEKFDSTGTYLSQFGTSGSGNGQFSYPTGITTDASGNIWVTDQGNNRVQKFNSSGTYLLKFGSSGGGNGQFMLPRSISLDASGNVWVVDSNSSNHVQKLDATGTYLADLGTGGSGLTASDECSISVDINGSIWVADYWSNRVQKFDGSGAYVSEFGSAGSGNGQFNTPIDIITDSSGNAWVVDQANNRVQEFNSSGTFIKQFGSSGSGNGQFSNPSGIAISSH